MGTEGKWALESVIGCELVMESEHFLVCSRGRGELDSFVILMNEWLV